MQRRRRALPRKRVRVLQGATRKPRGADYTKLPKVACVHVLKVLALPQAWNAGDVNRQGDITDVTRVQRQSGAKYK